MVARCGDSPFPCALEIHAHKHTRDTCRTIHRDLRNQRTERWIPPHTSRGCGFAGDAKHDHRCGSHSGFRTPSHYRCRCSSDLSCAESLFPQARGEQQRRSKMSPSRVCSSGGDAGDAVLKPDASVLGRAKAHESNERHLRVNGTAFKVSESPPRRELPRAGAWEKRP